MTISRTLVAVALAVMVACAPVSAMAQAKPQLPPQGDQNSVVSIMELAEVAAGKMTAGDLAGAGADLQLIIEQEEFALSSDDFRARIHLSLAVVKLTLREPLEAMEQIDQAGPAAEAIPSMYWPVYLDAALDAARLTDAAHAAAVIAVDMPELMTAWTDELVFSLLQRTQGLPEAQPDRILVIDALWRTGFVPKHPGWSMEYHYQELLDARIREGDLKSATMVAATLKGPDSVQQLSTNSAYVAFAPADVEAALAEAFDDLLSRLYQSVEEFPDTASTVTDLASWLNHAGKPAEALLVIDAALARVADAPVGVFAFDDQAAQLEWLHSTRAWTLMNLGRWDEALDAQITAHRVATAASKGSVSQAANLGQMYLNLGKPEMAAKVIKDADPAEANEFGRMTIGMVQSCASLQLGKKEEAEAILSEMIQNASDAPGPLLWALQCSGDADTAAKLVAERLADIDNRRDVLDYLQRFLLPENQPPFFAEMEARKEALRVHPVVQAALKEAGKIMDWPSYN